jgi:hypothetical protein
VIDDAMTTFLRRMRGSGQTRPEGGAHAALGPARPVVPGNGVITVATAPVLALAVHGLWTMIATSAIGSSS